MVTVGELIEVLHKHPPETKLHLYSSEAWVDVHLLIGDANNILMTMAQEVDDVLYHVNPMDGVTVIFINDESKEVDLT